MAISVKDIAWASGFLEGEGSFAGDLKIRDSPSIQATQVQREPLERLQRIFGGTIYDQTKPKSPRHQQQSVWFIGSRRAIEVMFTIYDLMSPRRQERMRSIIAAWKPRKQLPRSRTHCPFGHEYNEENTYWHNRRPDRWHKNGAMVRNCNTCRRKAQLKQAQSRKSSRTVVNA